MAYQAAREVADDRSQPSRSSTILRGINQRVRETEGSERSNDSILSAVDFDGVQGEAALPNDFSEANGGHHHDQEGNLDLHEDNRAWEYLEYARRAVHDEQTYRLHAEHASATTTSEGVVRNGIQDATRSLTSQELQQLGSMSPPGSAIARWVVVDGVNTALRWYTRPRVEEMGIQYADAQSVHVRADATRQVITMSERHPGQARSPLASEEYLGVAQPGAAQSSSARPGAGSG